MKHTVQCQHSMCRPVLGFLVSNTLQVKKYKSKAHMEIETWHLCFHILGTFLLNPSSCLCPTETLFIHLFVRFHVYLAFTASWMLCFVKLTPQVHLMNSWMQCMLPFKRIFKKYTVLSQMFWSASKHAKQQTSSKSTPQWRLLQLSASNCLRMMSCQGKFGVTKKTRVAAGSRT